MGEEMNGTKVEWELSRHLRERERERKGGDCSSICGLSTSRSTRLRGYNNFTCSTSTTNSKISPQTCLHHPKNGNNTVNHSFTKRQWLEPGYMSVDSANKFYLQCFIFASYHQRYRYDFGLNIIGIMEKLSLMVVDGMNKQYSVCVLSFLIIYRNVASLQWPTFQTVVVNV